MTTALLQQNECYRIPELQGSLSPSVYSTSSIQSEDDRLDLVLKKLGHRAWGRLNQFRLFYEAGWGEGAGRPLSPRALEGFYRFLEHASLVGPKPPSLFLTDDGHLELCWEDASQKAVQVEFTPRGAEFYVESTGREGQVDYEHIADLVREFDSSLHAG